MTPVFFFFGVKILYLVFQRIPITNKFYDWLKHKPNRGELRFGLRITFTFCFVFFFCRVASSWRLVSFFIFSHADFRAAHQLTERLEETIYRGTGPFNEKADQPRTTGPRIKPEDERKIFLPTVWCLGLLWILIHGHLVRGLEPRNIFGNLSELLHSRWTIACPKKFCRPSQIT